MKIKIKKIDEPFEARVKYTIAVGSTKTGYIKSGPVVGSNFIVYKSDKTVGPVLVTSPVQKVINEERHVFQTMNSVYQYEVIGE